MPTGTEPVLQVATLIRHVYEREPEELVEVLDEVAASAAHYVPGAQYAGIIAIDGSGRIDSPGTSGDYPGVLDVIQKRHRQGPCLQAAKENQTVRAEDLTSDIRWPHFRREALAQTPVRSILSVAIPANGHPLSALNFYAERPYAFNAESEEQGLVYVSLAALAWTVLGRATQFRSALASRDIIGQAKGMLMERYHLDAGEAFNLLRKLSQHSNIPVNRISRRLVEAERPKRGSQTSRH